MAKRILIIDNDPDILEVMEEALVYEGFDIVALKHTDNIIETLAVHQVDLLLIDYILDGVNGGELCSNIKNNKATKLLPVIIMSAYSKVLLSLGFYGCDAFIAKPFDLTELVNLITKHTQSVQNTKIKIYV